MRIYVDSNVIIRATEGLDDVAHLARQIIRRGDGHGVVISTSAVAVAETLVGPLKSLAIDPSDQDALRLATIYASMIESHTAIVTIALRSAF